MIISRYLYAMKLFDDIVLFDEGKKQFTNFYLPGADLRLWQQFFTKEDSDHYYKIFLEQSPWQQRTRKMYDKIVQDPRLTAFYGTEGNPWTPELLEIKERLEPECKTIFNYVLLNYYRDGNDSVAWHSDTPPSYGKHPIIASVSFGETRVFKVRHKSGKDLAQIDIPLTHGSFLLMGETMQYHYEHHVPKTARNIGPRINLTFRM
jgi:alkylated DNA repair dioxygenase AlkB